MLTDYLRLILFATGLLIGVQVPGFVDQYAKRVSAHQLEAVENFKGFQAAADQYFGGSVEGLIAHHSGSADPVFQNEAVTIRHAHERLQMLTAELASLQGPMILKIFHVMFRANPEILAETRSAYSYTVPLDAAAIACGVVAGAVLALVVELLLLGAAAFLRPRPRAGRV
jgi:hypothetical protein